MIYGLGFFWPDTPQNIEAEQSVLGAILLDKEVSVKCNGDNFKPGLLQRGP